MERQADIHNTENFAVLSISYEKADAETRGKFTFFDSQIKSFVNSITDRQLGDAFVVSTCNRTEIYTTARDYMQVAHSFCNTTEVAEQDFWKFADVYQGTQALNHLFRVAGGLESQILGDFEIVGQIKNAYHRFKKEKKYSNPFMERAINSAIQISKRIKTETGISSGAASVSFAAVHYILSQQIGLQGKNILLVGTGEIGQNTVANLMKHIHQPKVKIANRTEETAEKIAEKYQIPYIPFEKLAEELQNTDILIVATGASSPIIHPQQLPGEKPMLILDLSVPHNVAREVAMLPNITVVNVDQLSEAIAATLEQRRKEIPRAEEIIREMTEDFQEWEKKRLMAPNIHHFKAMLKNIERNEMHSIHRKHRYVAIDDMELTEKVIQKITNRFAKYIIDHPDRSAEITELMHDILVEQPNREYDLKHPS